MNEDDRAREREVVTEAIQLLKTVRKQELGQITTLDGVIRLLRTEGHQNARGGDIEHVCERLSVLMDALAFHAEGVCEHPETIHGIIMMLSEMREVLRSHS